MNLKYNKEFYKREFLPRIEQGWSAEQMGKYVGKQSGGISMWHCAKKYATPEQLEVLKINGKIAQQNAQLKGARTTKEQTIKRRDENKLPEIINLVNKGHNVYEISKHIRLWYGTIYRILQRNNNTSAIQKLKLNLEKSRINNNKLKGKKISKARREIYDAIFNDVVPLIEQGLTAKQIGDIFNRDQTAIHNLVKRCGKDKLFKKLKENNARRRAEVAVQNGIKLSKEGVSKGEKILHNVVLKHHPNAIPGLPIQRQDGYCWFIDIAIPEYKLAVEFDGTYWHTQERDKRRDESLLSLGWTTLRLRYDHIPTFEELEKHFLTEVKQYIS
jgi:very-short-patch-repair endonuclease/predicted transcriptional regulator